jgi:Tol biopolymer transport system component
MFLFEHQAFAFQIAFSSMQEWDWPAYCTSFLASALLLSATAVSLPGTDAIAAASMATNDISAQSGTDMASPTAEATLTVNSVDLRGDPLSGMWAIIRDGGKIIKTGFTPLTFTGMSGTDYMLHATVSNYDGMEFNRWQDNGSTERARALTLVSDSSLTAVYDVGDTLRGFTPLTYAGDGDRPELTVNAVASGNDLRMWTLIDPQPGESEATYMVYVHNYLDLTFDRWEDGSTAKTRTLTVTEDTVITAHYKQVSDNPEGQVTDGNGAMYFIRTTYEVGRASTEVYRANPDGSNEVRLTINGYIERGISFSPDGKVIVFSSTDENKDLSGRQSLYVMDSDGTDVRRLTASAFASDTEPAWSPDGTKIAFSRALSMQDKIMTKIHVLDMSSGRTTELTGSGLSDTSPRWSPDGGKIVFSAREHSWPGSHIYIMNSDGTDLTRISADPTDKEYLHFASEISPDGKQVAYATPLGIRVANSDGSQSRLLEETANTSGLTWTPDSTSIVFSKYDRYGSDSFDLFIVDARGSEPKPLIVTSYANESTPRFKPTNADVVIDLQALDEITRAAEEAASLIASTNITFVDPSPAEIGLRKVVFVRDDIDPEIWVINTDGSGRQKLTDNLFSDYDPAWSPNGEKIAFASNRDTGSRAFQLYAMNGDGSDVRRLTSDDSYSDMEPAWSPDGSTLAFSRSPESESGSPAGLYLVSADGTGLKMLVETGGAPAHPSWSPDGTRIAFTAYVTHVDYAGYEIFVIDADGSNAHQLTSGSRAPVSNTAPSWSPDGTMIAFESYEGISVMDSDGNNPRVIGGSVSAANPSWSPDGSKIIFSDVRNFSTGLFDYGLFIMNPDGTGLQTFINAGDPLEQESDAHIGPIAEGVSVGTV